MLSGLSLSPVTWIYLLTIISRICPGRLLAEDTLWIAIVSIIYLFDLTMPTDEKGNPIRPEIKYGSALVR